MRRHRNKPVPRLEILESRVMLSVGDSPANVPGQVDWQTTLHTSDGSKPEVTVDIWENGEAVRITGSGHGNLSLDLSQLPTSVVNLQISSFESITLTGEATLGKLVISDVKKADAGHVSLDVLATYGVEYVRIDTAPQEVQLSGPKDASGSPTIGAITLLETNHFSTAGDAVIYGFVQSLGLATSSHVEKLPTIIPAQSVLLNFQPDEKPRIADVASISEATLIRGDFTRYFFASPAERAAMISSSAVFLQPALVEHVSGASFLGTARLQALLGEGSFDNSANVPGRPVTDKVNVVPIDIGIRMKPVAADQDGSQAPLPTKVESWQPPMAVGTSTFLQPTDNGDHAHVAAAPAPEPIVLTSDSPHVATSPLPETVLGALSVTLAHLSEPFVHAISDLQGRFSTFGEIASAQVTEKLRTDGRPALLVDTRSASASRNRAPEEVIVVNV